MTAEQEIVRYVGPKEPSTVEILVALDTFIGEYSNIAKVLAGAIVAAGLYLTFRRTITLEKRAETDSDRMKAENFTKAIEQLGHKEIAIRLGGIYALERIAKSSIDYHWPIMETLTAYVRENASLPDHNETEQSDQDSPHFKTPVDIQAVITVLARRETAFETENHRLDLSGCFLRGIDVTKPGENNLSRVSFKYSQLWWARFENANLAGADFGLANLAHACLSGAKLRGANFLKANLFMADLSRTDVSGANFNLASLDMVDFDGACGDDETYLPDGPTIKPCFATWLARADHRVRKLLSGKSR